MALREIENNHSDMLPEDVESGSIDAGETVVLRSLIRQELGQGLRGLKSDIQEGLRCTLREELPQVFKDFACAERRISKSSSHTPRHSRSHTGDTPRARASESVKQLDGLHDRGCLSDPVSVYESDDTHYSPLSLHVSTKSEDGRFDGVLPGSIEEEEIGQRISEQTTCSCGNVFVKDATFCRKCGLARPGTCVQCHSLMKPDAKFCRKCGHPRSQVQLQVETPSSSGFPNSTTPMMGSGVTKTLGGKHKKHRNKRSALFKTEHEVPRTPMQRFVTHRGYEMASGCLIVFNSFFLGFQVQYMGMVLEDDAINFRPLREEPSIFVIMQFFFMIAFTVELVLRWVADGFWEFFKSDEVWWNLFDITIVFTNQLEMLLFLLAAVSDMERNESLKNIAVIRVLRIIRIVRVARVIRTMKFFRELRMMLYSIIGSVKNLLWVMVVLLLTFYLFGVGFVAAVSDHLDTAEKWRETENETLVKSFSTIDRSVLTLFMAMSGGNDWIEFYEALVPLPAFYRMGFLLFIAFALFAVVNIVTGVFVESAMQANIKDKDIIVAEELQAKKIYLQSMQELFEEMDEDGFGTITLSEFEGKLHDERVVAYFNVLKLDVSDARTIFRLLDEDDSGAVGIDEFLEGCYKLQGESRSLDMKIMQYEVKNLQVSFRNLRDILLKETPLDEEDADEGAEITEGGAEGSHDIQVSEAP